VVGQDRSQHALVLRLEQRLDGTIRQKLEGRVGVPRISTGEITWSRRVSRVRVRVVRCPTGASRGTILWRMERASSGDGRAPDPRHAFGRRGEAAARDWLESRGWEVVGERFRVGRNEIDLVVRRAGIVAFVEVKARHGVSHGAGREAIGWRKRQAIARVAEVWRLRFGLPGECYRFDVIEVRDRRGRRAEVNYLPDAWRLDRAAGIW
jgi:putative endonuclease